VAEPSDGSVLVVNAGSTSLKLSVVLADDAAEPVASLEALPEGIAAVGHRVVHGGARFRDPVVVDDRECAAESAEASTSGRADPARPPPGSDAATSRPCAR